jgi:hypothetical protein
MILRLPQPIHHLSRQQVVSLSQSPVCRLWSLLTGGGDGRKAKKHNDDEEAWCSLL